MNKSKEEIVQIYLRLLDYFSSGVLAFVVLKTLREEFQRTKENRDEIFISAIFVSTYNTVVLALANSVKSNQESVHLTYLFNCIASSKDELGTEAYNQLAKFIPEFQSALQKISSTINGAITLRNTAVAHLDRRHINNPLSLIQDPPITWDELEMAYNIVGSGLSEIGKHLGVLDIQPYATIANFVLAQQTRRVFDLLYGSGNVGSKNLR
ncbi:MAG TPA: hypothetical protein VK206_03845 [Anaerolineales bacterium]|nr:hypothetical protein [Anaerolineales bacterium]